jgi:hypothetical protein
MNERIEALLIESHRQTEGGIYKGHPSVWTEKFAELLIRECIAVHLDDYGVDIIGDVLKKHFGVEL